MSGWACLCGSIFESKRDRDKHVFEKNQFVNKDPDDVHAPAEDFSQPPDVK